MSTAKKTKKNIYKVYQANQEAALGFWILPLIALIFIGLFYIFLTFSSRSGISSSNSNEMPNLEIKSNLNLDDVTESRINLGQPLNLEEIPWGKDNPFDSY